MKIVEYFTVQGTHWKGTVGAAMIGLPTGCLHDMDSWFASRVKGDLDILLSQAVKLALPNAMSNFNSRKLYVNGQEQLYKQPTSSTDNKANTLSKCTSNIYMSTHVAFEIYGSTVYLHPFCWTACVKRLKRECIHHQQHRKIQWGSESPDSKTYVPNERTVLR